MNMAKEKAKLSKDSNTKVGACIVDIESNKLLGFGFNAMPKNKSKSFSWKREGNNLETKYPYICHAELNCILDALLHKKDISNSRLYVTLFPCNECAKIIVQSGIKEVYYEDDKYINNENGKASIKILDTCKIKIIKLEKESN